jgi:Fur family ferric uptake transcriptional regulator
VTLRDETVREEPKRMAEPVAKLEAKPVATLGASQLPKLPTSDRPLMPYAPACATFRRHLRGEGLKFTPERAAVLDVVLHQPALFDAESVADELKKQGHRGSRATVYRTLGHLQKAGLLRQTSFGAGQAFFEVVAEDRPQPVYVVDVESGEILAVAGEPLRSARDTVCRALGVEPVRDQFHIYVRRERQDGDTSAE